MALPPLNHLSFGVRDALEIAIVAYMLYRVLLLIHGTRAVQMLTGIVVLVVIYGVAWVMQLTMITYLLGLLFTYGAFAGVVIFQPELRQALAHLGQSRVTHLLRRMVQSEVAEEIVAALERLSQSGIGAIIAVEREMALGEYVASGSALQAKVSTDLLTTIFTPYSPLHDGAVIVRGDTVIGAGCILAALAGADQRPHARDAPPSRAGSGRRDRRDCAGRVGGDGDDFGGTGRPAYALSDAGAHPRVAGQGRRRDPARRRCFPELGADSLADRARSRRLASRHNSRYFRLLCSFPNFPIACRKSGAGWRRRSFAAGTRQRVTIVAVTKTLDADAVHAAWSAGVHDVGENRVQEALAKMGAITEAGAVAPHRASATQQGQGGGPVRAGAFSGQRPIGGRAARPWDGERQRPIDVLVQVNVVGEASKFGWAPEGVPAEAERLAALSGVRVRGVMTMAPLDADEATLRTAFAGARDARDVLRAAGHPAAELSMGMSNDYEMAVEEGATMVRVGTALFGVRASPTAGQAHG